MRRRIAVCALAPIAFGGVLSASGIAQTYKKVLIDNDGLLNITLEHGSLVRPEKLPDQIAFGSAAISPDHRTVGWLALYPDNSCSHCEAPCLAGTLVLYRKDRVLHQFSTAQVFWDWQFWDKGKRVGYSTGPTHGGAGQCLLRDVETGAIVSRWLVPRPSNSNLPPSQPPKCAEKLRY